MVVDVQRGGEPMRNIWLGLGLVAACAGKAPPSVNPDSGGGGDDAAGSNAATSVTLSGKLVDYFTNVALDTTAITTDGLVPAAATTSAADGAYTIDVAVGSKLFAL